MAPSRRAVAIHQDPRRRDRTGRRHHHRKGASELARRVEHGAVAGKVGLRGQDVHRLRAGDARDQLHGEGNEAGLGIGGDVVGVLERLQHADEHRATLHPRELAGGAIEDGALHLEDDIGIAVGRHGVGRDGRPDGFVGAIRKGGAGAGAGLDDNRQSHADHALDRVGRGGDPRLVPASLFRNGDLHRHFFSNFPAASRHPPQIRMRLHAMSAGANNAKPVLFCEAIGATDLGRTRSGRRYDSMSSAHARAPWLQRRNKALIAAINLTGSAGGGLVPRKRRAFSLYRARHSSECLCCNSLTSHKNSIQDAAGGAVSFVISAAP